MMRLLLAMGCSVFFSTAALAHEHCDCSKECQSQCQKGHGENCKCKNCDCAKTGKCDHNHCNLNHKDEKK